MEERQLKGKLRKVPVKLDNNRYLRVFDNETRLSDIVRISKTNNYSMYDFFASPTQRYFLGQFSPYDITKIDDKDVYVDDNTSCLKIYSPSPFTMFGRMNNTKKYLLSYVKVKMAQRIVLSTLKKLREDPFFYVQYHKIRLEKNIKDPVIYVDDVINAGKRICDNTYSITNKSILYVIKYLSETTIPFQLYTLIACILGRRGLVNMEEDLIGIDRSVEDMLGYSGKRKTTNCRLLQNPDMINGIFYVYMISIIYKKLYKLNIQHEFLNILTGMFIVDPNETENAGLTTHHASGILGALLEKENLLQHKPEILANRYDIKVKDIYEQSPLFKEIIQYNILADDWYVICINFGISIDILENDIFYERPVKNDISGKCIHLIAYGENDISLGIFLEVLRKTNCHYAYKRILNIQSIVEETKVDDMKDDFDISDVYREAYEIIID